ncbi:DUF4292 domain-containing protein [Rufibacter tibetensis]|uniref:DUF4292 domain-containing protein n=1 Tax=Rufibacter tibetensis TaxID=512763 RepID=A0A0P0CWL6_9BACT|nr:DUF4292 domain-containing protein [Rufibacter tibetensis]ALI98777.1 hypothetical protein DC20_07080 [Rufibacter tibetensis]
MNKNNFLYTLGLSLLVLVGCQKKVTPSASGAIAPETMNKVSVVNTDYTYFSAKGKVQSENSKMSANLTLRMKKNEVIWASLQAFGFEAARLKVTPDSVYIVNKLKDEYLVGSYEVLRQRYNVDVDFKTLQDILIGNFVASTSNGEKLEQDGPNQHLRTKRGNLQIDQYVDTTRYKLKRTEVRNLQNKDYMSVDYKDFEDVNGKPFAMALLLSIQQPEGNASKTNVVAVKHRQVSTAETSLDFPFSVPSNYERK